MRSPKRPSPSFDSLIASVRECTLCSAELEHGVRPVLQVHPSAKILVAGQAPGSKVHATGVPFDDPSGDRLREWMGIDKDTFYDEQKIGILPMGFCFPGKGKSGDLPPIARCAETWRRPLLNGLPNIQLTLVIGQYAQNWHLETCAGTLTETVKNWKSYPENVIPLPHPSPRNNIWLKKNDWFENEMIPVLRRNVSIALTTT